MAVQFAFNDNIINDEEIFRWLIDNGLNVNSEVDISKNNKWHGDVVIDTSGSLLNVCIRIADLAKVKILLEHGADANKEDSDSKLPLYSAIDYNIYEAVELLLEHRADANAKNSYGRIPLISAVENNNLIIVRCLAEHGADVNAKDDSGKTVLMHAVFCRGLFEGNIKIVRCLVEHGANVNPNFDKTWVPYWYELWKEGTVDPEIVSYLRSRDYIFNGGIAILLLLIVAILSIVLWREYRRKPNEIN